MCCSGIVHDQWTRFDRLSPDKFIIAMFQHSLHQAQKNADEDTATDNILERLHF